jgi:hypothetical protein
VWRKRGERGTNVVIFLVRGEELLEALDGSTSARGGSTGRRNVLYPIRRSGLVEEGYKNGTHLVFILAGALALEVEGTVRIDSRVEGRAMETHSLALLLGLLWNGNDTDQQGEATVPSGSHSRPRRC